MLVLPKIVTPPIAQCQAVFSFVRIVSRVLKFICEELLGWAIRLGKRQLSTVYRQIGIICSEFRENVCTHYIHSSNVRSNSSTLLLGLTIGKFSCSLRTRCPFSSTERLVYRRFDVALTHFAESGCFTSTKIDCEFAKGQENSPVLPPSPTGS